MLRPPVSAAARRKQQIGGALLLAGIAVNLVATMVLEQRTTARILFTVGTAFVLASIVYMFVYRRAA